MTDDVTPDEVGATADDDLTSSQETATTELIAEIGAGVVEDLHEVEHEADIVDSEPDIPEDTLTHAPVEEEIEFSLPRGSRTIVVSDLHLGVAQTPNSLRVQTEIVAVLSEVTGPAAFIINGDGFEMLAGPADIPAILTSHQDFTDAVMNFSKGDDHTVIILSGNHDGQIAWDGDVQAVLKERLGAAHVGLNLTLSLETDKGTERVRIIHGNQVDPFNTFEDPFDPVDTPFGHHIVREILPEIESRQSPGSLLEGVHWLDGDIAEFAGSRLFYRKLVGKIWLLAIPFIAVILLRLVTFLPGVDSLLRHHADRWIYLFGGLIIFMVIVAGVAAVATLMRVNRALKDTAISNRADFSSHNAPARAEAARLVTQGFSGLISGHTHEPELSVVGDGFYANSGSGATSVTKRPSRFRLPNPFISVQKFSYVELITGAVIETKLWLREIPERSPVFLERLGQARVKNGLETLHVAGTLPTGPTWPINKTGLTSAIHRRRIRRIAEAVLLISAVSNIVFTLLWRVHDTQWIDRWIPFGTHPMTVVESVVVSIALLGLARGLRRGLRPAWIATIFVMAATTADRLSLDHYRSSGSILAVVFCLWLLLEHKHFRTQPQGVRRLFVWLSALALALIAGIVGIGHYVGIGHTMRGSLVIILLIVTAGLLLFSAMPGRDQRRTGVARQEAFVQALKIVEAYGGDTLDYFALRDDKTWFFTGNSLVAYSVINGVMLISPDPIGPAEDRADVWSDVMDFADARNWSVTVLAASESWLPIYRAAGLADHYIGDEAIVDAATFTLQGKAMKSLRGAYNRIQKSGLTVECFDALSQIPKELQDQLLELMTETRQGEAERGFSMTLSRIFDPRDEGLLLAVCFDEAHKPVAFNQYIPAKYVNGYSLDLMRRTSDEDAPNGLTDFVIIETLLWMGERGLNGLGLNFATMRAVVAGESGDGTFMSLERSLLHHFSESMQIESLWKFNKKYDPYWNPRYVVTGPLLPLARSSLAIARAEGVTEIPVVGPLLKPRGSA